MKAGLKRWVGRVPDISAVIERFPIPAILMAIFTVILIFVERLYNHERLGWLLLGLVAAAYMCVNIVLARETNGKSKAFPLQIGLSLVLAALAWFSEDIRFLLPVAVGGAILLLGNMVRWKKGRDDLHVWDFTHKIWTGAIFATAGSIIYLLGILAIMAALKSLFGLNIERLMQRILFPVGFGLLAPLYWLSTIPAVDEDASELYDNPGFVSKAVAFMGTWLLSPLTLIYALILMAYGVKIILAGELPKGEIAQLTTPFLLIGTLTWLVLDPPFAKDKVLAKLFRKSWFFLIIPAALLLGVAVFVRIGTYGLTWERIGLALCMVWALALGIWFSFGPKDKRDIRLIPGLAAGLMFAAAFIAQPLSFQNQKSRAVDGLKSAGVMNVDGVIKPQSEIRIVDEDGAKKAKGALQYLLRNNGEKAIIKLFDGADDIPNTENLNGVLYTRLNLDDINLRDYNSNDHQSFYSHGQAIDVRGYDLLSGPYWMNKANTHSRSAKAEDSQFTLDLEAGGLKISYDDAPVTAFDIEDWVKTRMYTNANNEIQNPRIEIYTEDDKNLTLIVRNVNYQTSDSGYFNIEIMLLSAGF